MCEGEEADFASQLTFPLPVYVHLCHFYDVADFELQCCLIIGVWHARLFDTSVCWEFSLKKLIRNILTQEIAFPGRRTYIEISLFEGSVGR